MANQEYCDYFNLSACTQRQIFLSATLPTFKASHIFMRSRLFQPWHITDKSKTKEKKNIKACTKCATACHESTQHKLDQLFSSCHEHTGHSVDSEPMHSCCCFLYCYSNVPPQSCVLQICQTARKAQLASSVLSGIPSTCSDYSEDVDTDASVFSLGLQAGGRTPPYYKNKA